MIGADL